MKNLTKLLSITLFSLLTFSCSSDDNNSNQPQTIAAIASSNPNLSILVQALNKAGLTSTFDSPGDFTVFAPTNDKFQAFLTANGFANLDAVPVDVLTEILKNHVVSGSFYSNELTTGYVKTLAKGSASATNTLSMFVQVGTTVKLNGGATNGGATVVTADIEASNGVIHIVDNVIGLPTVVNHAIANPDFSNLVGALTDPNQPDFVSVLSGTGPFTVFAPNNAAFTSLNTELAPGGIAGVSAANLTKVLQYHVVSPANVLSSSLTEGQVVTPILTPAQTFTVLLSGGARLKDANNRECNIVATDVQASNGVIHVLSKVLLPAL
ncbi:fasciclin domain-containing protein [Flavobacterium sp. XGLA_31]|uniref:fasciclin domain-containing protein n=1 Tax=Flavobacterium sp. XGLA_31 TaxID=3447666 RepID=UPI003F2B15C7